MSDVIKKLQSSMDTDPANGQLFGEALQEITGLRKKLDALEEILIILARTELPWDENGNTTDAFPHFKERYLKAMHEASELVGLQFRSTITRTEPRT